ncbi:VWA domain-containing protein [Nocardioides zeae]
MVDLTKRTETATASLVSLMKKAQADGVDLGEVSAACVLVMDHSGSMRKLYKSGHVQDLAERVLALSLTGLDDDGDIQVVFFDHKPFPAETVNAGNYAGFVDRWDQGRHYGTTNYADTIATVLADVPSGGAPPGGCRGSSRRRAPRGRRRCRRSSSS